MGGKTVVVTGTASGLGKATVRKFAEEQWNVVATVRKEQDLGVHADLPLVRTVLLDVTDQDQVAAFGRLAVEQFGLVDVLVNNAGYYQMGPLEDTTMRQVRDQFET